MTIRQSDGAAASLMGIVQFALSYRRFLETGKLADDPTVLARITGPMGHWMTFGGEQLIVWCAAVPALVALGLAWVVPISISAAALILGFTRSVWIGWVVAVMLLLALRRPRLLVYAPGIALIVITFLPMSIFS